MSEKKILLLDDEERLVDLLGDFVEDMGHAVEIHTSSTKALESFTSSPESYKLLITDHTMPELSGLALIAEIRKISKEFPCVLTSGAAHNEFEELVETDPHFYYLKKPYKRIHLEELLATFNF